MRPKKSSFDVDNDNNDNNNNNNDDDDDDNKQSFRSYLRKRRLPELDIIRSVVHPKSKANMVFISILCKKKKNLPVADLEMKFVRA